MRVAALPRFASRVELFCGGAEPEVFENFVRDLESCALLFDWDSWTTCIVCRSRLLGEVATFVNTYSCLYETKSYFVLREALRVWVERKRERERT